jgi:Ner family transcriptional regulator
MNQACIDEPAFKDWHTADIRAALARAGWSLRGLSLHYNYSNLAAAVALQKPWPQLERIIAETIGVPASTIWPSRYDADGNPLKRKGRRRLPQDNKNPSDGEG